MNGNSDSLQYRPEVDGLRAVAVVAVVLFHAGFSCRGGFVGVDVFFVISGFLITSLIMRELNQGKFSLRNFWNRRIRRILPAVQFMVLIVLLTGCRLLLPEDLLDLGNSAIAQSLLVANIYFWQDTGYFAEAAEFKPLLHTWSLAVEEQFYLGFPLLLMFLHRFGRKRLFGGLVAIAVFSFVLSCFGTTYFQTSNFFLLPTRAWELLAGSLVALLPNRENSQRHIAEFAAWSGIGLIVFAVFRFDSQTPFPGAMATIPVLGTVAFIRANESRLTSAGRILAWQPVVFVGLISYSLYLWHWPALVFLKHVVLEPSPLLRATAIVLSFGMACLSFRFVETPFRKRREAGFGRVSIGAAAAIALTCLAGLFIGLAAGFPSRLSVEHQLLAEDVGWTGEEYERTVSQLEAGDVPLLGDASVAPSFAIWGDSHAMMFCDLLDDVARDQQVGGIAIVASGIPPVPGLWLPHHDLTGDETNARNRAALECIKRKKIRNVFLVARWTGMCSGFSQFEEPQRLHEMDAPLVFDAPTSNLDREMATQALTRGLRHLAADMESAGINLVIIRQMPETDSPFVARQFLLSQMYPAFNEPPVSDYSTTDHAARIADADRAFAELADTNMKIVDPMPNYFAAGISQVLYRERAIYRDNDHLTRFGSEVLLRSFFAELLEGLSNTAAE